jgi:RimJ/RimL family protein N-acetyltransferase
MEIRTQRLILRRWRATDRAPFAALNADPEVMEHFPGPMTAEASDAFVDRIEAFWEQNGYGRFAVEVPGEAECIGFVGIQRLPFLPKDEIGWRLARPFWGRGYATEAAQAALRDAFERLELDEVVSITVPANVRSTRVMERIGLKHHPERDFDHPMFPIGHRLSRHVLYATTREEYFSTSSGSSPA